MPTKIAAGNWKMNGLAADAGEARAIGAADAACAVVLFAPATLLARLADAGLALGGQHCHAAASGAHTGDVSAAMLADAGATWCLAGHSERRADHGETDADVAAQVAAARAAGLLVIVCIGETLAQREAGETLSVLAAQLDGSLPDGPAPGIAVAYEPVWAIGTGRVAAPEQVAEVHDALRERLGPETSLLYGGSVKGDNAAALFALANVDGALVGGASLRAADFLPIVAALDGAAR